MPKTNMAPLDERVLFLGIILLFTSGFISSSPANIPVKDVRDSQDVDTGHVGNEIRKSVDENQEDKTSKLVYSRQQALSQPHLRL